MLDSGDYDEQWNRLFDFIRFNPGARHRRRLIVNALQRLNLSAPRILDVGCGLGFTIMALSQEIPDAHFHGVDFSPVAIEGARSRFPVHDWTIGNIYSLGELAAADVVICTEVIEHLDDWQGGLASVCQLVQVGGRMILTTQSGKVHATEQAVGHLRHFKIEDLDQSLLGHGFEIEQAVTWGWPGYVALKYVTNLNSELAVEKLGSGKYGLITRFLNGVVYRITRLTSLRNHPRGSQIMIVAVRKTK